MPVISVNSPPPGIARGKIVLVGPPGSGKGSVAERLRSLNIEHISSGDLFREKIRQKTPLGRRIETAINTGNLVPDVVTLSVLRRWFWGRSRSRGFVLDGFPRNLLQALCFDDWMEARNDVLTACLFLDIPEEVALERISNRWICPDDGSVYHLVSKPPQQDGHCDFCSSKLVQRNDDKPATVRKRFALYRRVTEPVSRYYNANGILLSIDARGSLESTVSNTMMGLTRLLPVI